MKCANCGEEINKVLINKFAHDGSDDYISAELEDLGQHNAYGIATDKNWTGDELEDDEAIETVICPKCKKFPFKCKEINRQEVLLLTFWNE